MDFDTAKNLMEQLMSASRIFAKLSQDIEALEEPDRSELKLGLGKTMGEMYLELIRPIGIQHPSLDPANSHDLE